jgi:hypothetical protein
MINLQHHCSAAAERPTVDDYLFRINLANQIAGHPE